MYVQTGCSGNDSDIVIPSLPCSDSQPADLPCFLMDGLGTKHRVWFQRFGTKSNRDNFFAAIALQLLSYFAKYPVF